MKNKMIGILICTLLIISAAVPITGHVLKKITYESIGDRGTIYVDDDGGADYTKIQDAIENATSGDIIYVYAGTYYENIVVGITLDIVGENKDTTIIHGLDESDNAMKLTSDWCNVSEFKIENGGSNSGGIRVNANHCTISNVIFDDNIDKGIFVESSDYTEISDNTFSDNNQGLYVYLSDYTTISSNDISNNKDNGILCLSSNYNDILGNTIESNFGVGAYLNNECDYNEIISNTISSNDEGGIRLYKSDQNTVSDNSVSNNGEPGEDGGITCFYSNSNDIFKNTVNSNNDKGIFIEFSNSNTIYQNDIYDNDMYGISIDSSYSNIIYNNNIYDNTQNGNDDGTNTWYSSTLEQGNYWDDYTGSDNDGDGIGDSPYDIPGNGNEDEYPLMTMYGPPKADFTYSVEDNIVSFDGSKSYDYDGTIISYEWDFDDGDYGSGQTVDHTYAEDGQYDVELEVTDDDGKTDSTIISILVDSTPPEISDNTPDTATTGDLFTFNATVTDNIEVGSVTLNYKYDEGNFYNLDMINTEGDYWEGSIIVEHTLETLYYFIYVEDTYGNHNCSDLWNVTIIDNDFAEITDVKANPAVQMAGHYVNISAVVTDNIGLSEVNLYIEYPDSSEEVIPIIDNKIGDTYFLNTTYVPDGTYSYHILAKDTSGNENISETKTFEIVIGTAPEKPQINGPTSGTVDVSIDFQFKSIDGDDHYVYYYVDWGDGTYEGWFGPFPSGVWQTKNHTWSEKGDFTVKAKAKDITGLESGWSELTINIPRNKDGVFKYQASPNYQNTKVRMPRTV